MGCCEAQSREFTARDLAGRCEVCPESLDRPGFCRSSGASMAEITIGGARCPRGYLPTSDRETFVLWGAEWVGLPWPTRLRLAVRLGADPESWSGCGCLARAKLMLTRVASWPERWAESRLRRAE